MLKNCPGSENFVRDYAVRTTSAAATQRYKIGQELGSGSFSTIYEALDYKKQRRVAIKMEKPDKAKRILQQEYQFLKRLLGVQGVL